MRVHALCLTLPAALSLALLGAGCKFGIDGSDGGLHDMVLTGGIPKAVISSIPAPVGLRCVVDGSGSSDSQHRPLTYGWHLAGAPAGSSVDDKALSSTSAPTINFAGDKGGDYQLQLTVTAPDGTLDTTTATITVPTLPLFYRQSRIARDSDSFALGVVRSDGSAMRDVGCVTTLADPSHGDAGAGNRATYGDTPGTVGLRVLDGTIAKVVFEDLTASEHHLLSSDENGDCNARPPVRLDVTPAAQHLFPRFSPDGTRVAWIDAAATSQLYTVSLDGSVRHLVRAKAAKMKSAPPVWIDNTHVAWVEDLSSSTTPHLTIVQALDADSAGDTQLITLLDCNPTTDTSALQVIDQFAFGGATLIIAGGTRSRTLTPPGATQLYAMPASGCSSTAATLLASQPAGGFAWDFDLSPDGSAIVFAAAEGPGSTLHDIYRVLIGAKNPLPSRFVGSQAGVDDIGPRFIAGGRQLTWTQAVSDASSGGIVVANYDGSSTRTILGASNDGGANTFFLGGVNRGLDCAVGGERSTTLDAAFILLALCLATRRRQKRKP